jgi:hypothetical protein
MSNQACFLLVLHGALMSTGFPSESRAGSNSFTFREFPYVLRFPDVYKSLYCKTSWLELFLESKANGDFLRHYQVRIAAVPLKKNALMHPLFLCKTIIGLFFLLINDTFLYLLADKEATSSILSKE